MSQGAQHGIVGDEYGTDLPVMAVPEQDLTVEKNAAKFSKTKEFKALKSHLEARIQYYQAFLPDGRSVLEISPTDLGENWKVANAIVTEFKAVIDAYERAEEAVKNATERRDA